MIRHIFHKSVVRAGDALFIESTLEGQVVDGPRFTSMSAIVRFLGDDATRISLREGEYYRDLTEELASIWMGMYPTFGPYDADMVPEYVKRSSEWAIMVSEHPDRPLRSTHSLYANSAGRTM